MTTPSQNTYSYQQPTYYQTYPPFNPSAPALPVAQARPGIGAGVAAAGAGLAGIGLLALHWVGGLTYTDIFKTVKDQPNPSGGKAQFVHTFLSGGAYGVAGIGVMLALLWCCGVIGARASTRGIISGVQALLVATQAYGVYEYFDGHFHSAQVGVWMTLAGSAVLLAASAIGPRMSRTWQ